MHVYHFGAYEPSTFKRLSGRYATRETELDTILRAELFVDLHDRAARAQSERRELLDQGPRRFYGLVRKQDLRAATASRHAVEWAIEMREDLGFGERSRRRCTARALRRERARRRIRSSRTSRLSSSTTARTACPPRSCATGSSSCAPAERARHRAAAATAQVGRSERAHRGDGRGNAARASGAHRRSAGGRGRAQPGSTRVGSWRTCSNGIGARTRPRGGSTTGCATCRSRTTRRSAPLAGLAFVGTVGGTARVPVNRYSFPRRTTTFAEGRSLRAARRRRARRIVAVDVGAHTIDIQQKGNRANERRNGSSSSARCRPERARGAARDRALDRGQRHRRTGRAPRRTRLAASPAAAVHHGIEWARARRREAHRRRERRAPARMTSRAAGSNE